MKGNKEMSISEEQKREVQEKVERLYEQQLVAERRRDLHPRRSNKGAENAYSSTNKLLGIGGSLMLLIGPFAPLISAPIVGSVNYFKNGQGDGVILLCLAVISLLLALTERYKPLMYTGLAAIGLLGFTFFQFQSKMAEATAQVERELAGNPFRGLADVAIQSVQLQWGWALLLGGSILLLAAAAVKQKQI